MDWKKFFGCGSPARVSGRDDIRKYDQCWDEALNAAIDEFPVILSGHAIATVGPFSVWIENYPYNYAHRQNDCLRPTTGLPSLQTRKRLKEIVDAKACEELWAELDNHRDKSNDL